MEDKAGGNLVREIFVFALLVMVIVFTLGMLFYDYIPTDKNISQIPQYISSSDVNTVKQEIEADYTLDSESLDMPDWSYVINESDLKTFASKKEYISGIKDNPFHDEYPYKGVIFEYDIEEENINARQAVDVIGRTSGITGTGYSTSSNTSSTSANGTYFEKNTK